MVSKLAISFGRRALLLTVLALPGYVAAKEAPSLEPRFHELEDAGEVSPAQTLRRLRALAADLPPGDAAVRRRYDRLVCWNEFSGNVHEGLAFASAQLREAERAGDIDASADFRLCRGYHYEQSGRGHEAEENYQQALKQVQESGNQRLQADAYSALGQMHSYRGELAQAIVELQNAQRLYEIVGFHSWSRYNLGSVANTYRRLGDHDKALEYYQQLLAEYRQDGKPRGVARVQNEIGQVYENQGRYNEALKQYRLAIRLYQALNEGAIFHLHLNAGSALAMLGRHDEALAELAEARAQMNKDDAGSNALLNLVKAMAQVGLGQYEEALGSLELAESFYRRDEDNRRLAMVQDVRAQALAGKGDWRGAYEAAKAYHESDKRLFVQMRQRESARLRVEFDSARKEAENKRLLAERALNDQQVASLTTIRYWQRAALVLAVVMLLAVVVMAVRQFRRARRFRVLALTDELTKLPNRRSIQQFGNEAVTSARDGKKPASILVFDIDYFKRINDGYGHEIGDQVLVRVAQASQASLRGYDRVGRTGGEEFLAVLPETGLVQAIRAAERLRAAVAALVLSDLAPDLAVTISIGVAELKSADGDLRALTQRADDALYRAKANGRNRVEIDEARVPSTVEAGGVLIAA